MTQTIYSRYRWVVLFTVWLSFTVSFLPRFVIPPLIPILMPLYNLTNTQAGMLMTGFWIGYFLMQIPAGMVSDRIGSKRTIVTMSILIGLLSFLTGLTTGYLDLLAVRFLNGLACAFMFAPGQSLLLKWFRTGEKSFASGIYITSPYIGIPLPVFLSPIIVLYFGSWRYPFWIFALFPIFAGVVGFFLMRDPPKTTPTRPKISRFEELPKNASIGSDITSLLKNKLLWYNNMYRFGLIFSVLGAMSWAPKYLVSELQFSLIYAGFVSVLLMAPGIVGGPLGGATADRIMKRNAPTCLIGTLAYCFIPLYIAFSSMTPLVIIVVFFLYGFFNAFAEAPALAMFDELGFEKRMLGSALGISNFIAQIGGAMAPALFGLAIDLTGSFSYGWTLMGLTPLTLSAFALLLIYEGR